MVKDIVKQAIQIKLKSKSQSPLISPAEFCCASGCAVKLFHLSEEFARQLRSLATIARMREMIKPRLLEEADGCREDALGTRLIWLLTSCKVEGEVTEEMRELFDMGTQ